MNINWDWKVCMLVLAAGFLFGGVCLAGETEESIAVAVAKYLIAGREVVARNQPLINDPSKGDKGFTPEVYDDQVTLEFLSMEGNARMTLSSADNPFNKALYAVHKAAKEVIAEAQTQINEPGKGFKGFNPAVFGSRLADKLRNKSDIRIKQTSLRYRKSYDKPDKFEESVLRKFENGAKGKPYFKEVTTDSGRAVRYMAPLYIDKSCLPCHGEPAGEKDVTGYPKEGYKLGELRGAISVTVPIAKK